MKILTWMAGAAAVTLAAATPAAAQYYPNDPYRDRNRDTVGEVVAGIAVVAGAVAAATQGGYYDPRYGGNRYGDRYGRGVERHAVDACTWEAQRRYARYGARIGVRDVRWHNRNRLRVHGEIDMANRYDRYDRYDRRYDPRHNRRERLAFTCTVRPDGRVSGFSTQRYRY